MLEHVEKLTYEDSYKMRRNHIGKSCKLHFEVAPLKIVRASKQYMYDESGNEYLDCITNVSHVGHCHPHVVSCGQEQMARLCTSNGFLSDHLALYTKRLIETLPDKLCVCYFVTSGSEANDLALRLAKAYTGTEDIICVDNSYHGNLDNLLDISPLKYKATRRVKKDHVHVAPCPDVYRGMFRAGPDTPDPGALYANEVKKIIQKAEGDGKRIGTFISECYLAKCGVIDPPAGYLELVYRYVRDAGGVCISDEIQVGLGRIGSHYWAFQDQDIIPDIITCGKPLGNGHPMAVVITSKEIADSIGEFSSSYGGNPVSCAIGLAVLDVMHNEKLMSSAKCVGLTLLDCFKNIQDKHPMMGDVRGKGMIIGVEIVTDKESRKPAGEAAELLAYKMKEQKIIVATEGPDNNVITLTPPMCFTNDNARRVVENLDRCLSEIESGTCPDALRGSNQEVIAEPTQLTIPADVISGSRIDDADNEDFEAKRPRYEDVD